MSYPVLFVHGLIGTLQDPKIHASFGEQRTLAPDLLGYGALKDTPAHSITIADQAEYLRKTITEHVPGQRVYLVGHSVGGVIACTLASQHPDLVAAIVNVEGNFTLNDAFWTASIAKMNASEADATLRRFKECPADWLKKSGIPPNPNYLERATEWLGRQPSTTMHAMAKSVVDVTSQPEYLEMLQALFLRIPVHLLAGERSRQGWDVPMWALDSAASMTVVPGGHLMMLENPTQFGEVVLRLLCSK